MFPSPSILDIRVPDGFELGHENPELELQTTRQPTFLFDSR